MLGTLIFGLLGVFFLVGGCYVLWLTVWGSHDALEPGARFRPLFEIVGIYDSTLARRALWAVGSVSMLVAAVFFLLLAVWS